MYKNTPGQKIGAQMVTASDGSAFTSSVTVYVTGDAGTQAVGSVGAGACTHEGNGYHTYAPSQAETNYDLIAFTFIGTGAVPATVQVETKIEQLIGTPANFGSGNSLAQNLIDMVFQEAGTGSGTGYDRSSESLEGIATRLGAILSTLGTILSTQGVPQTGDSYGIVNDGTIGNSAIRNVVDIISNLVSIVSTKIGSPINLGSGNTLAYNLLDMAFEEAGSGTGTGFNRTSESLEALATRIGAIVSTLGTIQSSLGTPQTGDAYAVVSDPTNGNAAIRVVVDAINTLVSSISSKVGDPVNFGSGNTLAYNLLDMVFQESGTGSGTGYDRTTESLEAISARLGAILSTLAAVQNNQGTPQTGDSYPIVSDSTSGNAALKALIDIATGLITIINAKIGSPTNLGSGNTLALNLLDMVYEESGSGTGYDRTTESLEALSTKLGAAIHTINSILNKTNALPSDPASQSSVDASITLARDTITGLIGTPANFGSGNTLAYNLIDIVFGESGTGSGTGYDRTQESLEAISARIGAIIQTLGSIQSGQGVAQTGDSYAIVNDSTFGNFALKALIDALTVLASAITTKIGNPVNLGSGNTLAYNLLDMVYAESGSGTGTGYDRTTESLEALSARIGAILASLGVAQTGDSYAVVSDAVNGNAAIKGLIDALTILVSAVSSKIGNPVNLGSGETLAYNLLDMVFQEAGSGTGTGYDRTTESLEAIATRIGTVLASLGVPQTGDNYALLTNPTYGNDALRTLLDVLATLITDVRNKVGNPVNLGSGSTLAYNLVDMSYSEPGSGTGTGYDRTEESLEALRNRLDSILSAVLAIDGGVSQTGDAYAIVSDATYGNSALRVVLDAINILAGTINTNVGIPTNLGSGNTLAKNILDIVYSESGSGTGYDRTTESLEAISDRLELVKQIVSADMEVDTATTPWTVVYYIPGTSTVLFRKKLRDTAGANLTSESTIVGSQKEN